MLTDAGVKSPRAKDQAYEASDAGGLVLYLTPTGSKLWRMRYAFQGKEKLISFRPYPAVTLANARHQRHVAKAMLREGKEPSPQNKTQRALGANLSATLEVSPGIGTRGTCRPGRSGMAKTLSRAWRTSCSRP